MQLLWDGLAGSVRLLFAADPMVLDAAVRSVTVSISAVVLAGIAGIPIAYALARGRFTCHRVCLLLFRIGMSMPTVLIGLLCFAFFSRRGPLGVCNLLYTPYVIVVGEFLLATPIVVTLCHGAFHKLDRRLIETAQTLGAGRWRMFCTLLSEARYGISLGLLTAFARCITELGIAIMAGGNIPGRTRTLTTATALETARGEFERGVAMSIILLLIATSVTASISVVQYCYDHE